MGKFLTTARGQWRDKKEGKEETVPIESFTPGHAHKTWESESVKSVPELKALFTKAEGTKSITLLVFTAYATKLFSSGRSLDFLSINVADMSSRGSLLNPTCSGAKVVTNKPETESKYSVVVLKLLSKFDGLK